MVLGRGKLRAHVEEEKSCIHRLAYSQTFLGSPRFFSLKMLTGFFGPAAISAMNDDQNVTFGRTAIALYLDRIRTLNT